MRSFTWRQVHAWRLSQHCLAPRLARRGFVEAATRIGGIQAQVLSAAELALWARAEGLSREDVQRALWQERTLVKTWAMRGTLHLMAAADLPLYAAARSAHHDVTQVWVTQNLHAHPRANARGAPARYDFASRKLFLHFGEILTTI